jgi:hypothetical protein
MPSFVNNADASNPRVFTAQRCPNESIQVFGNSREDPKQDYPATFERNPSLKELDSQTSHANCRLPARISESMTRRSGHGMSR